MSRPLRLTPKQVKAIARNLEKYLLQETTLSNSKINFTQSIALKEKATVAFTNVAWNKLTALVECCAEEIGWHGTVVRGKEKGQFVVEDILVFPQTVTGATVTPDAVEYAQWVDSIDDDTYNKLKFHGHSHVRMGTNPSGVDTTYQSDVLKNLKSFYIFGIFNKTGSVWMTIYDVENNIVYEDEDITYVTNSQEQWAKEMIEKYVTKHTPSTGIQTSFGWNRYGYENYQKDYKPYSGSYQTKKQETKEAEEKSVTDEIMEDLEKYKGMTPEEYDQLIMKEIGGYY